MFSYKLFVLWILCKYDWLRLVSPTRCLSTDSILGAYGQGIGEGRGIR